MGEPHGPAWVLAVDFGGTKTAVGCAAPDGRLLAHRRLATLPGRGASQAIERAFRAGMALAQDVVARGGGELAGVGVVSPGVVLADRILLIPNLPGWESLSLPGLAAATFPGLPVATCNDARAAAVAELRWGSLRGVETGVYINVGTGVSAALIIDGRIHEGAHQAAGEIGYARPDRAMGTMGHLEMVLGGNWLARRASRAAGRRLSGAQVLASDTPAVRDLVDAALDELGWQLANFCTLIDPQRIVIGGGLMNAAERILPRLRRCLHEVVPFPPELIAGTFTTDAALRGAVALALDAVARAGAQAAAYAAAP
jgi:glucokinase